MYTTHKCTRYEAVGCSPSYNLENRPTSIRVVYGEITFVKHNESVCLYLLTRFARLQHLKMEIDIRGTGSHQITSIYQSN